MANDPERDRKLAELEAASERYVAFCGVVCVVAFFLLGWPALIAWVGLAWAMNGFVEAMRDSHRRSKPRSRPPHPHKPHRNRRRCD
ncbi:MAG: hypothetical protein E6R08_01445 [Nevskiaceae bacterium]|nr:MAG: hypothetical protein E6R08_01445 [Nevskiaceae bacterium]